MNIVELFIFGVGLFVIACCIGVAFGVVAALGCEFGRFLSERKETKR